MSARTRLARVRSGVARRGAAARHRVGRRLVSRPPAVDDLAAWCDARGLERLQLSPARTVVRAVPAPLVGPAHESFGRRSRHDVRERYLTCLPETGLWGANGHVVLPGGAFAVEAAYERHHLDADPDHRRPPRRRAVRKDGDWFSLLGKFSNNGNYYHWAHDALLRLHGVLERIPTGTTVVVPPLRAFQAESLDLLGVTADRREEHPGDELWECERLWFASLPPSGAEVPEAVRWLRGRLLRAAGVERTTRSRRLFISRAAAGQGRLVDEAELAPLLQEHGFEVVRTEGMSFVEQVRLFASAELVVAPHGAGETNLLFADDGCRVLEIVEPQWAGVAHAYVYWALAATLGQPFDYVVAEAAGDPSSGARGHARVGPEVLGEALRAFVTKQAP